MTAGARERLPDAPGVVSCPETFAVAARVVGQTPTLRPHPPAAAPPIGETPTTQASYFPNLNRSPNIPSPPAPFPRGFPPQTQIFPCKLVSNGNIPATAIVNVIGIDCQNIQTIRGTIS